MATNNIVRVYKEADTLNDATGWISPTYQNRNRTLNMGIITDSSFSGVVTLQQRYGYDGTIYTRDIEIFTDDTYKRIDDDVDGVEYQLKLTEVSSGSVTLELYK
jgi:hypothetical protein